MAVHGNWWNDLKDENNSLGNWWHDLKDENNSLGNWWHDLKDENNSLGLDFEYELEFILFRKLANHKESYHCF